MSMGSGAKKAAREQAAATREAAAQTAKDNKLKAQAAVQQQESMIARQLATDRAAELQKSQAVQEVEVSLATDEASAGTDELGRRRRPRDVFRSGSNSGLNL